MASKLDERTRETVVWRIDDLGLKHKDVAAFLNVSPGQFSKLLSGDRTITEAQIKRLALALGMTDRLLVVREVAA